MVPDGFCLLWQHRLESDGLVGLERRSHGPAEDSYSARHLHSVRSAWLCSCSANHGQNRPQDDSDSWLRYDGCRLRTARSDSEHCDDDLSFPDYLWLQLFLYRVRSECHYLCLSVRDISSQSQNDRTWYRRGYGEDWRLRWRLHLSILHAVARTGCCGRGSRNREGSGADLHHLSTSGDQR